jgi:predicted metalloprotease with PDZ domain
MHASFAVRSTSALSLALALAFPAFAQSTFTPTNLPPVPAAVDQPFPGTVVLNVDATNLSQQIFRMHISMPAKPGPMTVLYPQWLPGNHGPSGPITQLAGLKFTAGGKPVEWVRDPVQVFAFHVNVPEGATTLEADYDYLSPLDTNQGRITMTDNILGVQWNAVTLYPAGYFGSRIPVQANLRLPAGWQFGTALETAERQGDEVLFKPTDLDSLVDSPLFAGRYFKRFDLDPGAKVPVHLDVVADDAESLDAKPEQIEIHSKLIQQAYKLYGSHHYDHYDFLFALSDEFSGIGLEHHQSSENGVKPGYFTEWAKGEAGRDLLAHEYTHSWDGKFRRPGGQAVANFNVPLQNELLYVYEGQTQYWGNVLAARSGLVSQQGAKDALAAAAARYDSVAGRSWRAMQDTVYDPILNSRRPLGWANYQRSEDYYTEGQLVWLDADTLIRELSGDKRSLNDFAKAFFGINDGSHVRAPYTFEEVVATLNKIQPYDWAGFLRKRLDGHGPGAPLDGLARAGWKLVYTDTPTDYVKSIDDRSKALDLSYSLGFAVSSTGAIRNVVWDSVAFRAGLAANATIVAVNNTAYKAEVLKKAIKDARTGSAPIQLLVKKGDTFRTVSLDYHGGLRYPRLERIPGTKDRLESIYSALK